jgi:hypothetical protein
MTILLYLLLIGGLLIFMSQASYAYVIAKVDISTSERRVHCLHHAVHSSCDLLTLFAALALLIGSPQSLVATVCAIAVGLLVIDAISFLICNKTQLFAIRRDAIKHKWQGEKVFGPEHDREVSEYRVLKEITEKNLLRDGIHLLLFITLFLVSLL